METVWRQSGLFDTRPFIKKNSKKQKAMVTPKNIPNKFEFRSVTGYGSTV